MVAFVVDFALGAFSLWVALGIVTFAGVILHIFTSDDPGGDL